MYLFIYLHKDEGERKKEEHNYSKNQVLYTELSKQLCTNNHENNSINVVQLISYETNLLIFSVICNFAEDNSVIIQINSVQC